MGKTFQKTFLIYFIISFIVPAIGFSSEIEKLDFKESLELAFDHNPQMIEARKTIEAVKGDLLTTRTLLNPTLDAEIGGLKKNEEGDRKGHLETVSIVQPFDPVGVRELKTQIAKNEVKIGKEALKSVWSSVYFQVRTAYMKVILDKK